MRDENKPPSPHPPNPTHFLFYIIEKNKNKNKKLLKFEAVIINKSIYQVNKVFHMAFSQIARTPGGEEHKNNL